MAGFHFYIELLAESLGRAPYQVVDIADKLADQEGDASGGVGHMLAALEYSDPQIRITAAGLCGRAHSRGVTSDHDQSLMSHYDLPPLRAAPGPFTSEPT
jgi:hypothetical protein